MEGFVKLVVAGGITLVAGLWALRVADALSAEWLVGVGLVAIGVAGLAAGIWSEVDF